MARRRNATARNRNTRARWVSIAVIAGSLILLGRAIVHELSAEADVGPVAASNSTGQPPTPAPGGGFDVGPGQLTVTHDEPEATQTANAVAACPGCDVVVITVCSLRLDHVGVYGHRKGLTPAIDSIAKGGFHFSRAYAASNFTLAGLTALLTGRFGSSTGVTGWDKGLTKDIPTLPEVLGHYGYRTAAFTIDAPSGFRPDYGLDRGFQRMEIVDPPRDTPDGRARGGEPGPGGASADEVVHWLENTPDDKPVFAMFHTRSAHFPFVITDDGAQADATGMRQLLWDAGDTAAAAAGKAMPGMAGGTVQQGVVQMQGADPLQVQVATVGEPAVAVWREAYAEAVGRMDIDVARVLAAIDKRGRAEKTILLLVADHGESLYDHLELLHGDAYFDGVVNVPMLMRVPGLVGRPKAISALVSHTDILPTLLELVGATIPANVDGASMLPLLRGSAESVRSTALVEGGVAKQVRGVPRGAVVSLPYTLLRQERGCGSPSGSDPPSKPGEPTTCLFDVKADPGQTTNLARAQREVVADLIGRWDSFRATKETDGQTLELSPEMIKELQRTGYDFRAP